MSEQPPAFPGPPAVPPPASPEPPAVPPPASTFRRLVVIASFIPLGFALVLQLVAPAFMEPLFDSRAAIIGLPPALGFLVLLLGLVAIDLIALRFLRSTTAVGIVVAVTTTVGLFLVVLAPAIVLIAVNSAP